MNNLTKEQREEITSLIKEFEKKSSAELVAVLHTSSSIFPFLPKKFKKSLVKKTALKKFFELGLDRTEDRLGIMFFVSAKERQVEIIADEGICKKVSNDFWQEIVSEFIAFVKKGEFAEGYKNAIQKCSAKLIEQFPIKGDDKNELSDEVIEI